MSLAKNLLCMLNNTPKKKIFCDYKIHVNKKLVYMFYMYSNLVHEGLKVNNLKFTVNPDVHKPMDQEWARNVLFQTNIIVTHYAFNKRSNKR